MVKIILSTQVWKFPVCKLTRLTLVFKFQNREPVKWGIPLQIGPKLTLIFDPVTQNQSEFESNWAIRCVCEIWMPPEATKSYKSKISVLHFDPATPTGASCDVTEV